MINDINYAAGFSFLTAFTALFVLAYLAPKQMAEVVRPRNWLTTLRWQILMILIVSIIGLIPSVVYLGLRTWGIENELLRNVSTVTGNISRVANVILLLMVFKYKRKE